MSEPHPFDPRSFHARFDIAMIVACSENGVIGREGDLPWHLPDDLRHFMRSTKGCPVIMGRKTFDSLDKPLPARLNIVLSRTMPVSDDEQFRVARDLDESIEIAKRAICENRQDGPIWIAGGGTIYSQAMSRVGLIVRTLVHCQVEGDARFPEIEADGWNLEHRIAHAPDDRHRFGFDLEWWSQKTPAS